MADELVSNISETLFECEKQPKRTSGRYGRIAPRFPVALQIRDQVADANTTGVSTTKCSEGCMRNTSKIPHANNTMLPMKGKSLVKNVSPKGEN